jgi:hypothetical protein
MKLTKSKQAKITKEAKTQKRTFPNMIANFFIGQNGK